MRDAATARCLPAAMDGNGSSRACKNVLVQMASARIAIVGTSGSGKTTLAKLIAGKKNIPRIELDELYWQPNWVGTPEAEFHEKIKQAVAASDSWVLCGNYNAAKNITLPVATDIIWLNYPLHKNLWQGLKRSLKRIITGEEPFKGCKETFRLTFLSKESILHWILVTHARRRREFTALLTKEKFPAATIWIVKTKADYESLVQSI